uniref:Cyclin-dependent kinase 2 homolog n=1 Tax=Globisporangium ultimum (strain ATCC 200006 / CBS 805.95 / DAOM BR144) TaxID=431595 RepID=K3WM58_GLOUD
MESPQLYEEVGRIGSGAFGDVVRVRHVLTRELLAVKKLRLPPDHSDGRKLQVLPAALFQEIEALRQLEHPNYDEQVVKLADVFVDGASLSLVFEHMATDLFSILRHRSEPFEDADVRCLLRMLLHGVAHCHAHAIVHRDIKPGNLLLSAQGILKITDFGLATVFSQDAKRSYSHQVATRWYRAPELLFGSRQYDSGVDMWGVGAILAEFLQPGVPLFPGQNDIDQLFRILQVLGNPMVTMDDDENDSLPLWRDARNLPDFGKIEFPPYKPIPLTHVFPDAHPGAVDLLTKLLALDPAKRISAKQNAT